MWRHGQVVKTPPFHGGITSSNLVGVSSDMDIRKLVSIFIIWISISICSRNNDEISVFLGIEIGGETDGRFHLIGGWACL